MTKLFVKTQSNCTAQYGASGLRRRGRIDHETEMQSHRPSSKQFVDNSRSRDFGIGKSFLPSFV